MQKCHFEERSDEKSLFRLQGKILIVDKISHIRSKHGFLPSVEMTETEVSGQALFRGL